MANRWFFQFRKSLEKEVVDLYANVTFTQDGSSHAQAVINRGKGISSITRTGAGAYTIQLGTGVNVDTYMRLLSMSRIYIGTVTDSTSLALRVVADNSNTTGQITVLFTTAAAPNTGVELAAGGAETMLFTMALSNSFAP